MFDISSIGGLVGNFSGFGIYCATEFALAGLTESLRADLAPFDVRVTIVYPGYFRTEFLTEGSRALPSRPVAAYADARASEKAHVEQINGAQPGDPAKAAAALVEAYERPTAPLHLLLGSDALAMAEQKLAAMTAEIASLRALSVSTDF